VKVYVSSQIVVLLLVVLLALFLWFAGAADRAMSKDGVGDLAGHLRWSAFAGYAFWSLVLVWVSVIGYAMSREKGEQSQLLFICGVVLLGAPAVYLLSL
jgi:hypothetical protein